MPYPSRVPGTDMWQMARDNDAAAAATAAASVVATTSSAPERGRGRGRGRGGIKRKPAGDPDGAPTPKRSTRNTVDDILTAPVPAKGLLASAAEADLPAETPFGESPDATPEPSSFMATLKSKLEDQPDNPREKSPPLPRNISDPDEFGVQIYNAKPSVRERATNSRFLAPRLFSWDDLEIGFRDSQNDPTKGHTVTKRGKYLGKPDSNGFHLDHWCSGYDYSKTTEKDFDQKLVKKFGVHPRYGIFLPEAENMPGSKNEPEGTVPYVMPGRPVVFIAEPSGRISHASRSFQSTVNHNRTLDDPYRTKLSASLRRFCKLDGIDLAEVSVDDYMPSDSELRARSLHTAQRELEAGIGVDAVEDGLESEPEAEIQPKREYAEDADEEPPLGLFNLIAAGEYLELQEATAPQPPTPAPLKKQQKYDAIRDIFVTSSQPEPEPEQPRKRATSVVKQEDALLLSMLADCATSKAPEPFAPTSYYGRPRTGYAAMPSQRSAEAHGPASNQREIYRGSRMSVRDEVYDQPPVSNGRESYDRSSAAFPVPPRPSDGPHPTSSEREAPYAPLTPAQASRDPRMSIESHTGEAPRMPLEAAPAPPAYQPARHPERQAESNPYARLPEPPAETSPYMRHLPQQPGPQSQAPPYSQRPYDSIPQPQTQPSERDRRPLPPSNPEHMYYYGHPSQEQGSYQQQTQSGYPQHEQRDQRGYRDSRESTLPGQSRPYDHALEDRRMSGYSESPTYARPHWQQPAGAQPPTQAGSAQPPQPSSTPTPMTGYPLPPPPSRTPFGQQGSAEPLPPLRPPRGRLLGSATPDDSNIDPAMRQGPESQSQSGFSTFYSQGPSRGYPNNFPPPPQQGYLGSPTEGYGPPGGSPPFGTMMMHGSPDQGQSIFRHRSSASGPQGSASSQKPQYRQLQPAPIPPHRNWSSKPELKTIAYDHKDPGGNTAPLPSSGPTQIRGWQVNPQSRREINAQRAKAFGKPYTDVVDRGDRDRVERQPSASNEREDSR